LVSSPLHRKAFLEGQLGLDGPMSRRASWIGRKQPVRQSGKRGELSTPVRTENVVGRSDSAAKAFVGAEGVSPTDAESLFAFHLGDKWEYGRRFFLPGAEARCARHDARLCHAPLPAYATRVKRWCNH
jgi:hypothetical protein